MYTACSKTLAKNVTSMVLQRLKLLKKWQDCTEDVLFVTDNNKAAVVIATILL
jgi:ABC-type taurine transport system ATPase subunit